MKSSQKIKIASQEDVIFCQAQEIKRLRKENEKLINLLKQLHRDFSGWRGALKQAWKDGDIAEDKL